MKLLFALFAAFLASSFSVPEEFCLQPEERKLYDLLMEYRKQNGLEAIPISYSLSKVAKLHTTDLDVNNPISTACNLHSWSKKGTWSACCYNGNNASAECMWNKPRELSSYTGDGFEIAAFATKMNAENAFDGWKNSSGHNQVMINKGTWKYSPWKAVGVSITGDYAVIWFGLEPDPDKKQAVICP